MVHERWAQFPARFSSFSAAPTLLHFLVGFVYFPLVPVHPIRSPDLSASPPLLLLPMHFPFFAPDSSPFSSSDPSSLLRSSTGFTVLGVRSACSDATDLISSVPPSSPHFLVFAGVIMIVLFRI